MTHEKWKHYVAKACIEVSGKDRGWQNKSSSVRRIVEEQLEIRKGRGTTEYYRVLSYNEKKKKRWDVCPELAS